MDKKIGLMALIAILVIGMATSVLGAATFTPDCSWTYPSSNNMDLVSDTSDGNTTIRATAYSTYNMTNATFTITPYRNSTTSQVITSPDTKNTTWTATWADLDDATYTLGVTFYVTNNTVCCGSPENDYSNATALSIACTSRSFIVDTTEGSIIPGLIAQEEAKEDMGIATPAIIILLAGGAYIYFKNK